MSKNYHEEYKKTQEAFQKRHLTNLLRHHPEQFVVELNDALHDIRLQKMYIEADEAEGDAVNMEHDQHVLSLREETVRIMNEVLSEARAAG